MKEIKTTKGLFLWAVSAIYFFAFASIYHQIPGLYGDNGLLPVSGIITLDADAKMVERKSSEIPSLLWLAPLLGLDAPTMMEFLALVGMTIAFGGIMWSRLREATNFALLWFLYFSIYQGGQTFLWFQWDILLMETGFLAIIVAPLGIFNWSSGSNVIRAHDNVSLWLVRWLLFRFMFASGVVKLTSQCPTWWNLTALDYHFESQCIPTAGAWLAHHLPDWLQRLGVVATFIIEIDIPFLFFSPIRSLRLFSFNSQIFFQILIILTGNYNFFNLLTIALCISMLDDDYLNGASSSKPAKVLSWTSSLLAQITSAIVYGGIVFWTVQLFSIKIEPDLTVSSKIAFTPRDFANALSYILPISIAYGTLSLAANIILAISHSLTWPGSFFKKLFSLGGTIFTSLIAIWIFSISLIPHTVVDRTTANNLWPILRNWHSKVEQFHVVNSYGLFRRMTGVGGRPEIIIEGSNNLENGWREYHFLYKPGMTSKILPFIVPHQPRLDWQMWFAALGTYKENPWFASLIYRLLNAQPEVLALMDQSNNPFGDIPPKYIRATLYNYHFTPYQVSKRQKVNDWWVREKQKEYFPVVSRDHQPLLKYLKSAGISVQKRPYKVPDTILKKILAQIRHWANMVEAPTFIWALFFTAMTIKFINFMIRV